MNRLKFEQPAQHDMRKKSIITFLGDRYMSTIIKAKAKNDYVFDGLSTVGHKLYIPYKDYNIVLRCLREAWFRLHLPNKSIWYNPQLKSIEDEAVTIYDPLITPDFLEWVCDSHPHTQFTVNYSNRVERTGIKPTDITRPNLEYVSFDSGDCEKYGMKQTHPGYLAQYSFTADEKSFPEYDVIYLGRDKGRAEMLFSYKRKFEELGLKTYFHICADRSFLRFRKPYYKKEMPYTDYVELLKRTRSHLNIVQEGQTSVTQRDLESVFDSVKCITNNKGIRDFELYDPSRFFVLGEDNLESLPSFLSIPFNPVPEAKLAEYGMRKPKLREEYDKRSVSI